MKRIFTFVLTAAAVISMTACSLSERISASRRNGLGMGFSAEASIVIDRLEAEGTVKRFGEGAWEIEFSAPNTLSGVKLEFSEGKVTFCRMMQSFPIFASLWITTPSP